MSVSNALYSFDSKGWRSYHVEALQKDQCDIIASTCKQEAPIERYKAIAVSTAAALSGIIFVIISFALAKAAAPLFAGLLASAGSVIGLETPQVILFATRIFSCTSIYIIGLVVLKKMWDKTSFAVIDHWKYANHLDQQVIDVLLHKAKLSLSSA